MFGRLLAWVGRVRCPWEQRGHLSFEHEDPDMTQPAGPQRGSIITYYDEAGPFDANLFARAVATGPGIVDPETGETWLAARRADDTVVLLDPVWLVDVRPRPSERPATVHLALREALRVAVTGIGQGDLPTARELLADLIAAIDPARQSRLVLVDRVAPDTLTVVLGYLTNAADHLAADDVPAARAAVVTAKLALDSLLAE